MVVFTPNYLWNACVFLLISGFSPSRDVSAAKRTPFGTPYADAQNCPHRGQMWTRRGTCDPGALSCFALRPPKQGAHRPKPSSTDRRMSDVDAYRIAAQNGSSSGS